MGLIKNPIDAKNGAIICNPTWQNFGGIGSTEKTITARKYGFCKCIMDFEMSEYKITQPISYLTYLVN